MRMETRTCSALSVTNGNAKKKADVINKPTSSSVTCSGARATWRMVTLMAINKTIALPAIAARTASPRKTGNSHSCTRCAMAETLPSASSSSFKISGQARLGCALDSQAPVRQPLRPIPSKLPRLPQEKQLDHPQRKALKTPPLAQQA